VVGGGFELSAVSTPEYTLVLSSAPTSNSVWSVSTNETTGGGARSDAVRAYAVCAFIAS
jgi:hypothetical protein